MKRRQMEELIISDEYHLLRFKEEQSYISYQLERLRLYIKHLLIKESDNDWKRLQQYRSMGNRTL